MSLKRLVSTAVLTSALMLTVISAEANLGAAIYHSNGQKVWNGKPGWPIYHSNGQKAWNGKPGWSCYYPNGQIQTSDCNGTRVHLGSFIYLTVTKEKAYLEVGGTTYNLLNRSPPTLIPKPSSPSDGSTTLFNFFSKNFLFKNNCRYPVRLAIHYRKINGEWTTEGWWNIAPFKETYLASKGTRLTTNNSIWYYYAETTDGSRRYWKGDYSIKFSRTFLGSSFESILPMKKMQDNEDDNNWSISCW